MPDGDDANFLEVVSSQLGQDLGVNLVFPERLFVALKPQLPQPSRNVHGRPNGAAYSGTQVGHQVQERRLLSPQSKAYQMMRLTSVVRLMVEQMSEHLMERLRCATPLVVA